MSEGREDGGMERAAMVVEAGVVGEEVVQALTSEIGGTISMVGEGVRLGVMRHLGGRITLPILSQSS